MTLPKTEFIVVRGPGFPEPLYIKIVKKQQEKLIINGKTSHGGYIKVSTDYNDYNNNHTNDWEMLLIEWI